MLIIDGGSTDRTVRIVEEFASDEPRIKLIDNPEDDGPAQARAVGIRASRGVYLAFLDSDDLWLKDKLSEQVTFLQASELNFSFTGYRFLYPDGNQSFAQMYGWRKNSFRQYLGRRGIANSTVMLTRDCFSEDVLNTVGKSHGEDTLWWLLIMRSGVSAHCLRIPLTLYRRVPGSLSTKVMKNQTTVWHSYRNELALNQVEAAYHYARYITDVIFRRFMFRVREALKIG
jgi:teichuronic acid biosynthesis glycosyltransferase TuaG